MEQVPTQPIIIVARQNIHVHEDVLAEEEVEGTPKSHALSTRYEAG